jgi:hypothetical protein
LRILRSKSAIQKISEKRNPDSRGLDPAIQSRSSRDPDEGWMPGLDPGIQPSPTS